MCSGEVQLYLALGQRYVRPFLSDDARPERPANSGRGRETHLRTGVAPRPDSSLTYADIGI
jgi:hypothetical protein